MKQSQIVFCTDFGPVKCGPIFWGAIKDTLPALQSSKRTKAYKTAKARVERAEKAAEGLSAMYWLAGKTLTETP